MPDNNSPTPAPQTSNCLAYLIVIFVFIVLTLLSIVVLTVADATTKLETARYVFAAVVPLVGSWMGAIIAHYFQKENLAAATLSITDLAAKVSGPTVGKESTSVSGVMLKRSEIKSIPDGVSATPDDYKTIPLKALSDKLHILNQQRLPLFRKPDDSLSQVIHLSVIDSYLQNPPAAPAGLAGGAPWPTLQSFLDDPATKTKLASSFDMVAATATLKDVQKEMTRECEDVFVTQAGKPKEPVLGWITNDRLAEALKS